jgi:hypothetical protein
MLTEPALFYTKTYLIAFMDKSFVLTMASAIFFATLVFVILEIVTQSFSLVNVVVFVVIFGIGYPILYTVFTKRMKKSK